MRLALTSVLVVGLLAACGGEDEEPADFSSRVHAEAWVARAELADIPHAGVDGALSVAEDGWICDNDTSEFSSFIQAAIADEDNETFNSAEQLVSAYAFLDTYCPYKRDDFLDGLTGRDEPMREMLEKIAERWETD